MAAELIVYARTVISETIDKIKKLCNEMASAFEGVQQKKRSAYINDEQKKLLVDFMSAHAELQSGKFSATFTVKHSQQLWEDVTKQLHQIPGAVKEWRQWRKTWQDMRSSTKAKNTHIKNYAKTTGGGPTSSKVLSEIDENVLAIIGPTAIEGHETTNESNVLYDWDYGTEATNVEYLEEDEGAMEDLIQQFNCTDKIQRSPSAQLICSNYKKYTMIKENNGSEDNRNNINSYNQKMETKISTTVSEIGAASTDNALPIPSTPNGHSITKNRGIKRNTASLRFEKSISQTEKLAKISQEDSEIRKSYYELKMDLYKRELAIKEKELDIKEKELAIKERDAIAKENLYLILKQLVKPNRYD